MIELLLAFTLHLNTDYDYNEVHPHIHYEHATSVVAGVYKNSCVNLDECRSDISFYAGYKHRTDKAWVEVGGVTGYAAAPVTPFIRVGYDITPWARVFVGPYAEKDYLNNKFNIKPVIGVEFRLLKFDF
jgi:hypothetical protein